LESFQNIAEAINYPVSAEERQLTLMATSNGANLNRLIQRMSGQCLETR